MMDDTAPTTKLVTKWKFRLMLLAAALAGFLSVAADAYDRWKFSHAVHATIRLASKTQALPANWSNYEGKLRAPFVVTVRSADGSERSSELFLPKDVVEALLKGEEREIIYIEDNQRRFLMKGDPLPSISLGWLAFGVAASAVFLWSLRLN